MICVLSKFVLKMVNWLAAILVFSHSCSLVPPPIGLAMFGPAATAALCLTPL